MGACSVSDLLFSLTFSAADAVTVPELRRLRSTEVSGVTGQRGPAVSPRTCSGAPRMQASHKEGSLSLAEMRKVITVTAEGQYLGVLHWGGPLNCSGAAASSLTWTGPWHPQGPLGFLSYSPSSISTWPPNFFKGKSSRVTLLPQILPITLRKMWPERMGIEFSFTAAPVLRLWGERMPYSAL